VRHAEPTGRFSAEFVEALVAPETDVDGLGHVSNVAYVRWVQEIAIAHSSAVGWDWDAYLRLGAAFVVRRHELDYLLPVFAGERVELVTSIASWSAATSVRRTRIVRDDGRDALRAATTWALVSLETGRPRRIPPEIVEAFAPRV
jgi:acyl-CoA thioester hydrolase